jgi:predicted AAA+ superfamily ATPase
MKGVTESLAGRVCIFNMFGMSLFEEDNLADQHIPFLPIYKEVLQRASGLGTKSLQAIYAHIWRGSFPEMVLNSDKDWNAFYSSYVQTYLQRDVRDLARVGDETAFLRFLRAAAARTGQLLNVADLSRDADISPVTGKAWLSILEASGIIYLLEPYHSNITKRIVKAKKLYFTDTGLCCYLTGWSSSETLELGAMSGAILETWVIMEIIKSYVHNGKQPVLYYYRDKDQKEIDALILQDQTIYPIEIKKTAMPLQQHSRHFAALNALKMKVGDGGLICLTDTLIRISENLTAIPASMV